MLAVDGRGGAIFLADGVCMVRIAQGLDIGCADLRRECGRRENPIR